VHSRAQRIDHKATIVRQLRRKVARRQPFSILGWRGFDPRRLHLRQIPPDAPGRAVRKACGDRPVKARPRTIVMSGRA